MTSSPNSLNKPIKRKKSSLTEIRISVLGEEDVGKSAIVVRFLTRRFIVEYEHGVDKRYKHEVIVDNEPVIFDISDTTSTFTTRFTLDDLLAKNDILLLVYSITDRQSFNYIRNLLRQITTFKSNASNGIALIAIVGNKSDLVHLRQVSSEEGEILITEFNEINILYLGEISAADQILETIFVELVRWVKKWKMLIKASSTPSLLDRVVIGFKSSQSNLFTNS